MSVVLPYKEAKDSKKRQVAHMFDSIAGRYDLLNHLLSGGIDVRWRKKAISMLKAKQPKLILDIATGTGDFALEALTLNPEKVIGIDISEGMLAVGKEKIAKLGLQHKIELNKGDSEIIEYPDNYFDAVIVAFGVRNFENLPIGLSEMQRVLKKDGMVVILEFSKPSGFIFKGIYNFYFKYVLPFVGRLVSGNNAAYTYLPESVNEFPYGKQFVELLEKTGFKSPECKELTLGISSIYTATK